MAGTNFPTEDAQRLAKGRAWARGIFILESAQDGALLVGGEHAEEFVAEEAADVVAANHAKVRLQQVAVGGGALPLQEFRLEHPGLYKRVQHAKDLITNLLDLRREEDIDLQIG